MKKIILALATLAVIPIFISHGVAKADEWKTIQSTYNSKLDGCSRRDINACFAHYVPKYRQRDSAGQEYNLTRSRQSTLDFWKTVGEYRESADIIRRTVGENYAVVTGIEYVDYTLPKSSNPEPMRAETNFIQTWQRTSNGWKLLYIHYQNQKVYARGQVPSVPTVAP